MGTSRNGEAGGQPGADAVSDGVLPALSRRRGVRSFVRRAGRMTRGQRRAVATLWPRFGVGTEALSAPEKLFPRTGPLLLEVGFGMGDALAEMAALNPGRNYLGVDVYPPGIGSALMKIAASDLDNVRLVRADVDDVMRALPDMSLDGVLVFFPDPWPKKRHHKRRLIQPGFVELVFANLKAGGRFELATDWEPYALQMLDVVESHGGFRNAAGAQRFAPRPADRPATKFEHRGERLGHPVYDLVFERQRASAPSRSGSANDC